MFGNQQQQQPKPQQILVLESSTFMLGQRCFDLCVPAEKFEEIAKMETSERIKFDGVYATCMHSCVRTYVQSRQYLKDKFLKDLDQTAETNGKIYRSFLT